MPAHPHAHACALEGDHGLDHSIRTGGSELEGRSSPAGRKVMGGHIGHPERSAREQIDRLWRGAGRLADVEDIDLPAP